MRGAWHDSSETEKASWKAAAAVDLLASDVSQTPSLAGQKRLSESTTLHPKSSSGVGTAAQRGPRKKTKSADSIRAAGEHDHDNPPSGADVIIARDPRMEALNRVGACWLKT